MVGMDQFCVRKAFEPAQQKGTGERGIRNVECLAHCQDVEGATECIPRKLTLRGQNVQKHIPCSYLQRHWDR
jgi:hypothetical protein